MYDVLSTKILSYVVKGLKTKFSIFNP